MANKPMQTKGFRQPCEVSLTELPEMDFEKMMTVPFMWVKLKLVQISHSFKL